MSIAGFETPLHQLTYNFKDFHFKLITSLVQLCSFACNWFRCHWPWSWPHVGPATGAFQRNMPPSRLILVPLPTFHVFRRFFFVLAIFFSALVVRGRRIVKWPCAAQRRCQNDEEQPKIGTILSVKSIKMARQFSNYESWFCHC